MLRRSWGTIAPVAVAMAMATLMAGCRAEGQSPATIDPEVFALDRVAKVRITMAEDDWASMQADPLAKRYVPADFSFGGDVARHVAVRPRGSSSLQAVYDLGSPRFGLTVDFNLFNVAGVESVQLDHVAVGQDPDARIDV